MINMFKALKEFIQSLDVQYENMEEITTSNTNEIQPLYTTIEGRTSRVLVNKDLSTLIFELNQELHKNDT